MIDATQARPRHSRATIILLVLLTLLNTLALVALIAAWVNEVDHGADWGDEELNYLVVAVALQVIAVGMLIAAWFTRLWGAQGYLAIQAFGLVFVLIAAPSAFGIQNLLPLILAGILLAACNSAWRRHGAAT
ncbi:MAG TPA: hypothetical protein VGD67_02120 [Pseudonocardiaceae bacterium]